MFTQLKTRTRRALAALTASALLAGTAAVGIAAPAAAAPVDSTTIPEFPQISEPAGVTYQYVNWNINQQFWSHFSPVNYAPNSEITVTGGVIKNEDKTFSFPVVDAQVDGTETTYVAGGAVRGKFSAGGQDQYFVQLSDLKFVADTSDATQGVVIADVTSGQWVATGKVEAGSLVEAGSTFSDDVEIGSFTLPTTTDRSNNVVVTAPYSAVGVTSASQEFTGMKDALRSTVSAHFYTTGASSDSLKPMGAVKFEVLNLPAFETAAAPAKTTGDTFTWNVNEQYWAHFSPAFYAPNSNIAVTGGAEKGDSTFAFPVEAKTQTSNGANFELAGKVRGTFEASGISYFVEFGDLRVETNTSNKSDVTFSLYADVASGQNVTTGGVAPGYTLSKNVLVGKGSFGNRGTQMASVEQAFEETLRGALRSSVSAHFFASGASSDAKKPMGQLSFDGNFGAASLSSVSVAGNAVFGSTLSAKATVAADSTVKYQWLREGVAISGATSSTYKLEAADVAKKVSVKVTVARSGYLDATATSAAKTIAKAAAPKATKAPSISGTATFAKTLTAKVGTWNTSGLTYKYQWLRNGASIKGATKSTYKLTSADVAKKITVKVTASKANFNNGTATSAATAKVAKATPSVSAKVAKRTIKASQKTTVTVTVKASGVSKATGKVTVKVGKKTFTKTLKASHKGKVTVTVKGLKKGKNQKVTVSYAPSGSSKVVLKSKSISAKTMTVR